MPRRRLWLPAITLTVLALLVGAYLATDRESPPAPVAVVESAPAPSSRPEPVRPPEPEAPRAVTSTPSTPSTPSDPGAPQLPPTATAHEPDSELEISPEEPQTPKWRLEKTTLIAESLDKRVKRLEAEVREAEARGDRERAAAQRTLLERSQKRAMELEGEIVSLRKQVESSP